MYRLFEITSLAFGTREPFWNATWPNHWTESGREAGAQRFKNTKNSDPTAKYMKAVDDANGKIVGMAKWSIFVDHTPSFNKPDGNKGDHANDNEEKAHQQYLANQFFAERRDAIRMSNGNIVCLDILAVDPPYQRRGVASALVEWGTKKADELGLEAVVEGSSSGQGVYEKQGFTLTKKIQIQVPQQWAHLGGQDFVWLVRPKKN